MMAANPQSRIQKAINRATAERLFSRAEKVSRASWLVPGSECPFYIVRKTAAGWTCDCRAGLQSLPCKHQGAAWLTVIRDQAGGN